MRGLRFILLLLLSGCVTHRPQPGAKSVLRVAPKSSLNWIVLAWDSPAGATGYNLYQGGSSHVYTNTINCGPTARYTNYLSPGTYYFAVTAYNQSLESLPSTELVYLIPTNTPALLLNVTLEKSYSVSGPYLTLTNWTWIGPLETNAFFRSRLTSTLTNR